MKTNCWLILATTMATAAVAQVNTNTLPEIPPPAVTAPAATAPAAAPAETKTGAPVKKAAAKKKKAVKKTRTAAKRTEKRAEKKAPEALVTLVAGPATVTADHVNLRGQAGLRGEVVGHVQKGDSVTVLSEITLEKAKAGEPAQWAKIALPTGNKVWVDSKYVDPKSHEVAAKKLNLRGGPGENYSVLGTIEQGAAVTAVTTKDHWIQIEPPAGAFAFMAANYLKQEAPAVETNVPPVVATTEAAPPVIPPTPTTVAETQPIAPPVATPPPTPETTAPVPPPATPTLAAAPGPETNALAASPEAAETDTNVPPPPRIVTHEGTVRHSVSPVAPTYFELYNPATDKAVDYLYTTSTNLNLSRYDGLHLTVTGEEGLDPRWPDTPVLTIEKIYVLSGKPKPVSTELKPVKKRWWQK